MWELPTIERGEPPDEKRCPACHGTGTQYSTKSGMREECPMCEGDGKVLTRKGRTKAYRAMKQL